MTRKNLQDVATTAIIYLALIPCFLVTFLLGTFVGNHYKKDIGAMLSESPTAGSPSSQLALRTP